MSGQWFIHDMLNNNNHHKSACTECHSRPGPERGVVPYVWAVIWRGLQDALV